MYYYLIGVVKHGPRAATRGTICPVPFVNTFCNDGSNSRITKLAMSVFAFAASDDRAAFAEVSRLLSPDNNRPLRGLSNISSCRVTARRARQLDYQAKLSSIRIPYIGAELWTRYAWAKLVPSHADYINTVMDRLFGRLSPADFDAMVGPQIVEVVEHFEPAFMKWDEIV